MWEKAMDYLKTMSSHGIGPPDRLNHVHAIQALLVCQQIDEAIRLVESTTPSSLLAFHLVMLALAEKGDVAKCQVGR